MFLKASKKYSAACFVEESLSRVRILEAKISFPFEWVTVSWILGLFKEIRLMFLRRIPTREEEAHQIGAIFFHFLGDAGGDNSFSSYFFLGLPTIDLSLSCTSWFIMLFEPSHGGAFIQIEALHILSFLKSKSFAFDSIWVWILFFTASLTILTPKDDLSICARGF